MKNTMKRFAAAAAAAVFGVSAAFTASASSWLEPGIGSGSTTTPTTNSPVFSYASEFSVWANGRDVKDDKKTPYVDETALYKTGELQHIAMSTGGKWNVVVTDSTVATVSQFLNMFDDKGKFTDLNAKETKQIASAKIKDGTITVTGGKKAGRVNVWVYEINQKQVIYLPQYSVAPRMYAAEVKMAPTSPVLAEEGSFTYRVLNKGAKAVSKLTLAYGSGAPQNSVKLELGDKKDTPDMTTSYTVDYKNADKTTDASVVRVRISADNSTVTVTPTGVGKSTVSIINTQSGKAAKLSVEVKPMRRVIFDSRYVTVSDVTDKNAPIALYSGDSVIDGGSILVTAVEGAQVDEIQIGGKSMKSGGTFKVSGGDIEVVAGKTYPVTITGADKNNTVKSDGKAIKSGAKFLSGTKLTLELASGASASVETGGRTTRYYRSADIIVSGDTTITITVPEQPTTKR